MVTGFKRQTIIFEILFVSYLCRFFFFFFFIYKRLLSLQF
jgi:hypothetical protein